MGLYNRFKRINIFCNIKSSVDFDLSFQNFSEELANLPGDYARPFGRLYIAYFDGEIAGCIALRRYSDEKCEMKRLYVREKFKKHFIKGWDS